MAKEHITIASKYFVSFKWYIFLILVEESSMRYGIKIQVYRYRKTILLKNQRKLFTVRMEEP